MRIPDDQTSKLPLLTLLLKAEEKTLALATHAVSLHFCCPTIYHTLQRRTRSLRVMLLYTLAGTQQDTAMEQTALPCLDLLEATPGILHGLMCELSSEDAQWKPAPERFSVAEVLAHLAHSEGSCYRLRVDRFISEDMPRLEPDEAKMHLDRYRGRDAEAEFVSFEELRKTNIDYLRKLPAGMGNRRAFHQEAGEILLSQMLHEWALHDLGHLRQIAELVRARRYLPGAGPLGESYQLKP